MTIESLLSEKTIADLENSSLKAIIKKQDAENLKLKNQIQWLTEQLLSMKRTLYGKKSERFTSSEQLEMVFNEAEVEASKEEAQASDELLQANAEIPSNGTEQGSQEISSYKRKRGCRKPLPENLERQVIKIELPESELETESGQKLVIIGWETSEKLSYEPAKVSVIEYHRAKYGFSSGDYVKTAPPVHSVIPKGIATPELLASILVGKYADGLPLYRMSEIFGRQGIELDRTTMARWVVKVSEALMPIRNVLSDRVMSSYAIACDETKTQVLKEDGRKPETQSWMIVRATPCEEKKVVLFDYSTSRSQATMKSLFAGYSGKLLCDGLETYSILEFEDLIRFGCNMHGRRKFEQALVDGSKSGQSKANEVMVLYGKIYESEERLRNLSEEERVRGRKIEQEPLHLKIKEICEKNRAKVPPKSKLGEAIRYYLNEYTYLTRYLEDGKMEPDNGFTERSIRKFAIGRNNWLFSDTPEGADASALIYSLVITAKVNKVNPYKALVQILTEIPKAKTIEEYERLADLLLTPQ